MWSESFLSLESKYTNQLFLHLLFTLTKSLSWLVHILCNARSAESLNWYLVMWVQFSHIKCYTSWLYFYDIQNKMLSIWNLWVKSFMILMLHILTALNRISTLAWHLHVSISLSFMFLIIKSLWKLYDLMFFLILLS